MTTSNRILPGIVLAVLLAVLVPASTPPAVAQDFYDPAVLRTIALNFHDANWLALLRSNYYSQTNILADMVVDGVTYPDVGVRIRGNTSYTSLPPGSDKFSLNVDVEFVHVDQNVMGYKSLNLNNGFHDPTFCREIVYNNYAARWIPNMRSNHVVVQLNGANWGVYNNVQQFDKTMLSTAFPDTTGLRVKCANNPMGPGLKYNGSSPSGYTGYEIKDDGGFLDPWPPHIAVCNSVTNEPLASWQNIDPIFAIDPSIWSVVLENILTDDDSYVNKGADFMTYRNPTDGRTYLLQTDANETFTQTNWSPTLNFNSSSKPVLNHVLAVAELRQRYMAHYRTIKGDLNWTYFEPLFLACRDQIDAAVNADPKKLYSYQFFRDNFTITVNLPYTGPAGGTLIGLKQFVDQRLSYLNTIAELTAVPPTIVSVTPSDATPDPVDPVTITANVQQGTSPILKVELFYRPNPTTVYQRTAMTNAGSNNWTARLPITAKAGQHVDYYVGATASNSYSSSTFFPKRTEWAPLGVDYTFGGAGGMRITEWMYSGTTGEFIEFTNMSGSPVDMTGWSFDDDHELPGTFSLSAFGTVQPGESVILTEADAATFRTAWGLAPTVKVIGQLGVTSGNNLARNDEINLYDAAQNLVDRLAYGDQTYPGTIRTQNASGQACSGAIGINDVTQWKLSTAGDVFGSHAATSGEIGTPGNYPAGVSSLGEVAGVRFDADKATLRWDALLSSVRYDVPRGLVSELPVGSGASETCLAAGGTTTTNLTDATLPAQGAAFWYLVRGRNACGVGSYGNTGTTVPLPRVTGTCP